MLLSGIIAALTSLLLPITTSLGSSDTSAIFFFNDCPIETPIFHFIITYVTAQLLMSEYLLIKQPIFFFLQGVPELQA